MSCSFQFDVTVIIPIFNAEKYLEQCLNSVLIQKKCNIQVVCVDDGSTDGSLQIIKNMMVSDSRIELIIQKHHYAGVARNIGLELARGKYVHFLDSDDWMEPNAYQNLVTLMNKEQVDFIKFRSWAYDDILQKHASNSYVEIQQLPQNLFNKVLKPPFNSKLLTLIPDSPWSGFYNRDFLIKNKIYFDKFICVNDVGFFYRCMVKAKSIFVSDCKFLHYRVNNPKSLVGIRGKHFECQIKATQSVLTICRCLPVDVRKTIENKVVRSLFFLERCLSKGSIFIYRAKNKDQLYN